MLFTTQRLPNSPLPTNMHLFTEFVIRMGTTSVHQFSLDNTSICTVLILLLVIKWIKRLLPRRSEVRIPDPLVTLVVELPNFMRLAPARG